VLLSNIVHSPTLDKSPKLIMNWMALQSRGRALVLAVKPS
jgi:hypothetical protein